MGATFRLREIVRRAMRAVWLVLLACLLALTVFPLLSGLVWLIPGAQVPVVVWLLVFVPPIVIAGVLLWSRRPWWWYAGLAVTATLLIGLEVRDAIRTNSEAAVNVPMIHGAAAQFFVEHPERVFVGYDDLVGPDRYIRDILAVEGEDYHSAFPLRRDDCEVRVTMPDRRRIILWCPNGWQTELRDCIRIRETASGRLQSCASWFDFRWQRQHRPGVDAYRAWRAQEAALDGVQVKAMPDGGRFETTYRRGVREGPFRAYDPSGRLCAAATYANGAPVGALILYDEHGQRHVETIVPPRTPR